MRTLEFEITTFAVENETVDIDKLLKSGTHVPCMIFIKYRVKRTQHSKHVFLVSITNEELLLEDRNGTHFGTIFKRDGKHFLRANSAL